MILRWLLIALLILPSTPLYAAGTCGTSGGKTGTSPYTAETVEYADVADCYADVEAGATIILPAGSANWGSKLDISKAITIQGSGSGCPSSCDDATAITATDTFGGYLGPINITISEDVSVRITGLTINAGGTGKAFTGIGIFPTVKATQIRIDHNKIYGGTSDAITTDNAYVFGVIDNNNLAANRVFGMAGSGETEWAAENATRSFSTGNTMFIEDNIISFRTFVGVNGGGGTSLYRYNTITKNAAVPVYYSVWDTHGNQGVTYENFGTITSEMYGNYIDVSSQSAAYIDHRGGWMLNFYNYVANSTANYQNYYIREEYADDQMGSTYVMKPTNTYLWANYKNTGSLLIIDSTMDAQGGTENCCKFEAEAWQNNHVYPHMPNYCAKWTNDENGNCWKSIANWTPGSTTNGLTAANIEDEPSWSTHPHVVAEAGLVPQEPNVIIDNQVTWYNMGSGTPITENVDYFVQKTGTFDGTGVTGGGVGCGSLATMNAITTCTNGVGFWATDQSCSDIAALTGAVGRDGGRATTATKLAGTLYKCSSNTWTAYYTPYTYPHPLRGEGGVTYYTLTVTAPTHGTITTPEGINCGTGGSICTMEYDSTTSAVLTFTADQEWRFSSASDDCAGTARGATCTLAMSAAKAAGATFVVQERVPWFKP